MGQQGVDAKRRAREAVKLVMVTGGRDYRDYEYVAKVLAAELHSGEAKYLGQQFAVIQGGATGADRLAKEWCEQMGIPCFECKANWKRYSNSAGPIRNGWILGLPVAKVIAFPGDKGTRNAVEQAYRNHIPVQVEKPAEHKWDALAYSA